MPPLPFPVTVHMSTMGHAVYHDQGSQMNTILSSYRQWPEEQLAMADTAAALSSLAPAFW